MLHKEHLKGSISELEAAKYFLKQGYQVYFPIVRQGKVDLIVENFESHYLARIQVKTATWNKSGPYKYLQCRTLTTNGDKRLPCDMDYEFLVVVYEEELWIFPSEIVKSSNITLRDENSGRNWDFYKVKERD